MFAIISIIVPAYNVEPYLHQCIDSLISQTCSDIEILLIDDGSTDQSGAIIDSYVDPRIRVFHTENRGLSAARNLGIENAIGDYLFFVDADDWIESDALQRALQFIGTADILCMNYITEDGSEATLQTYRSHTYTGQEALEALLNGDISNVIWNKLYRKECFSMLRFPEGRICEDTASTHKLLYYSTCVECTDYCGYHYRIREGSLSRVHDKRNMIDYWKAISERFYDCKDIVQGEARRNLLQACAWAIMRAWAWRNTIPGMRKEKTFYSELSTFAKEYYPYQIRRELPINIHIGIRFAQFNNEFSFWIANKVLIATRFLQGKSLK